jgi:hypothetical protein
MQFVQKHQHHIETFTHFIHFLLHAVLSCGATEHMITMATISKTDTENKLLSIQEKLDIINKVDATQDFPCNPQKTA